MFKVEFPFKVTFDGEHYEKIKTYLKSDIGHFKRG
jgi:hypothetical protein